MMIYVLFLISLYQAVCYGEYVTEIDDCIRNGVNISPGSVITQGSYNSSTCGFIMQANQYIVIQPILVNISMDARIRLFLITQNSTSTIKTLIHEYYSRFLFRNLIFVAEGSQKFALVVLNTNASNPIGSYKFLFRTECFVEMASEDFPRFNTPNFYPRNPALINLLERNNNYYKQCSYKIFSKNKTPFSVKFNEFNNWWYGFYISNMYAQQRTTYSFNGQSDVYFNFSYYNNYPNTYGFNGSVEISFDLKLVSLNGTNGGMSGIPMFQTLGQNFTFQYGSLSPVDGQIMCNNLGFGGLESISKYRNSMNDSLMYHEFRCTGPEKRLSQCVPITTRGLHYRKYYYRNARPSILSCSKNFPIRLVNGDNSFGLVQVKVAGSWGYICAYNMDQFAGDVLCRELGFKGALDVNTTGNNYYWQYWSETVMSNLRCESHSRLKDCYYQTGMKYFDMYSNNYYYNNEYGTYQIFNNYYNYYYYSGCWSGVVGLFCQDYVTYSLTPGHFKGFLVINQSLVCDDDNTLENAKVYCRALGYPGVWKYSYNGYVNANNYTTVNMRCNGTESSPASCPISYTSNCPNNKFAGIICQTVALAGGSNPSEGRVEVFYKGKRGLLCDDYFNTNDGNVICRQLGFSSVDSIYQRAGSVFGYGNGIYLLNNLGCNGNESSINDCYHYPWGQFYCGGNDVPGLSCRGNVSCITRVTTMETNLISENGTITTFGANPWQVRLITHYENEWCSATILNRNWIITSANCFTSPYYTYYIATMSSTTNWNSYYWTYTNYIQSRFIHPSYSAITGDYNIALVKLSYPMAFSSNVLSICLPSSNFSLNGTQCKTTGWNHGLTSSYRPLMGKAVNVKSSDYCMSQTRFGSSRMERYLCSDNNMEPSAVFNGESGGPLVCSVDGQNTLVGVVGRSINGARASSIRLFARVDYYLDWIQTTMNQN